MKLKFVLILSLCLSTFWASAEVAPFKSKIAEVTVYQSGARITRTANINIPAGQTELVFSGLTTRVNPHSLQAQVPEGLDLLMVHYKTNFLVNAVLPEQVKKLNEEVESLQKELDWNKRQIAIYTQESKLLTPKSIELSSHDKGISVQDLKDFTSYYRDRSLEIQRKLFELTEEGKTLADRIRAIENELGALHNNKGQETGEVVFSVQSKVARRCEISFSYISNQAGWTSVYDLKAKDIESPLALMLKASVFQNTGVVWDQVKLSISTGNPLVNNDRPILRPRYVTFVAIAYNAPQVESYTNTRYEMAKRENAQADQYVAPTENVTTVTGIVKEYQVNIPQTIPSSGLKRLVQLKQYDIEAEYKYHCVPKLDQGVYLLAEVANLGQYNLLPGVANIFFKNMYIGQSTINTNVANKKMLLSLGRDEAIKVQRERTNFLEEKKFLGANEIQNIEYTMTIINSKNKKIDLEVLDQVPIAQHEDIKIELKKTSNASFDEITGGLKWDIEMSPGKSKKIVFSYTLKSPRNKPIAIN